jgi:hypothetical protein
MRQRATIAGLLISAGLFGALSGCSSEPPGTDQPLERTKTAEEIKQEQQKVMEGMKGGYQGAPGVPKSKPKQ